MNGCLSGTRCCWGLLLAGGLFLAAGPVSGGEAAAEFLQALRERGYHDMALEYLEQLRVSPQTPPAVKAVLLFEKGATLSAAASKQGDLATRLKQLDEAGAALRAFQEQSPQHPRVSSAQLELGNILLSRARINLELSKRGAGDADTPLAEARRQYDEALKLFERSQIELNEKVAKLVTIDPKDKAAAELRDRLKRDRLEAQMLAAAVTEERADVARPGSEDRRRLLTDAAKLNEQIAERYRDVLAGFYARMYQGRCYQKLGEHRQALTVFGDILAQVDSGAALREVKTKTMLLALDCWARNKPPLNAEAVSTVSPWIDGARASEITTDDWLRLRLGLARAQWALAQEIAQVNAKDPQVKRLQTEARKHAGLAARERSGAQEDARKLVASWGGKAADDKTATGPTFDEARLAGQAALDTWQTANLALKTLPARLQQEKLDEATQTELKRELEDAKKKGPAAAAEAKQFFREALALAGRDTELTVLNRVRYYLCFLFYNSEDYYDAAVIGEFVARRHADDPSARECAKITLACYAQLYSKAPPDDRDFEATHIVDVARYITQKWPDQPEAVDARSTLIQFLVRTGDVQGAEKNLEEIPADSPRRADAEIKTGQVLWSSYLKGMQEVRKWEANDEPVPAGVDVAARKTALEERRGRAQKVLAEGLRRAQQADAVTEGTATAALALVQIYVDGGQAGQAVALLEDDKTGPLALVRSKHPAAEREGFAAETYKTALRAYVSTLAGAPDPAAIIRKADEIMDAMRERMDEKVLTGIFVALARDLENQMKLASPEAKKALSQGFETFLTKLRTGAAQPSVLTWVAETFASLAASFDRGGLTPPEEAQRYYQQAVETYDALLEKLPAADAKQRTAVLLRKAAAKRRLTKFTEARDIYREVLQQNNMVLSVQVEAAKLYQEWATHPGKEALYEKAMGGAEPDPKTLKNIIWGWGRLALTTAKYPEFRRVFHESRYNLALCRFRQGRAETAPARQKDLFERAKQDILRTQQLFGVGPEWREWRPRYDALLREIQKTAGEKPAGLPADSGENTPKAEKAA